LYGVGRAIHRAQNAERLRVFLSGEITVAPFEENDAIVAGELRSCLARLGTPIGP
jgi:predicted nucleic acid-binding protein